MRYMIASVFSFFLVVKAFSSEALQYENGARLQSSFFKGGYENEKFAGIYLYGSSEIKSRVELETLSRLIFRAGLSFETVKQESLRTSLETPGLGKLETSLEFRRYLTSLLNRNIKNSSDMYESMNRTASAVYRSGELLSKIEATAIRIRSEYSRLQRGASPPLPKRKDDTKAKPISYENAKRSALSRIQRQRCRELETSMSRKKIEIYTEIFYYFASSADNKRAKCFTESHQSDLLLSKSETLRVLSPIFSTRGSLSLEASLVLNIVGLKRSSQLTQEDILLALLALEIDQKEPSGMLPTDAIDMNFSQKKSLYGDLTSRSPGDIDSELETILSSIGELR
ncbi:MAG: hypothetical protein HRU19_29105 [Pseudobacteriovorax sp.]|nr:hypothetical protein [Pseudobacteriovorax sp.]